MPINDLRAARRFEPGTQTPFFESPGAFVQERMFREGDVFPEGIGRDRREGPVTWIVMGREDGGPTREA